MILPIDEGKSIKDFIDALYETGIYPRPVQYGSNILCPFHENKDTPAARLFQDVDSDSIWCYVCNKQFKFHDLLERYGSDAERKLVRKQREAAKDSVQFKRSFDFISLDGFKVGEFGIEAFFERLKEIKYEANK